MAASFCFNFKISENSADFSTEEQPTERNEVKETQKAKAEFVTLSQNDLEVIFKENYEIQNVDLTATGFENDLPTRLVHLSEAYVENLMRNSKEYSTSATNQALKSHSDLIPCFYEGGMKIWECSIDLVNFLNKLCSEKTLDFDGKTVLELGCGAGLPGIYAWCKGANVYFQDYNTEVLKLFTVPNVALNSTSNTSFNMPKEVTSVESLKNCKFISGDWKLVKSLLKPMSFDVILTSETIYNYDMQETLYELIKFTIKRSGTVFVAAKSYYFGVGGGTDRFVSMVVKDGVYDISKVATFTSGVKREILLMERKPLSTK